MNKTESIINKNFERYESFEGYFLLIEKIKKNVNINPDITIEICKALIEGISKTILKKIDNTYVKKDIDKMNFVPLFKKAMIELDDVIALENDFINRSVGLIDGLGDIRNGRGDISHGKIYPKEISSDINLSNLVIGITDELLNYILNIFFSIDFAYEDTILYEENIDFNDWLDDENNIEGISYSQALYNQDYILYINKLEEYKPILYEENEDFNNFVDKKIGNGYAKKNYSENYSGYIEELEEYKCI